MSRPRFHNPGWAGNTGDFEDLAEADVRGTEYVGDLDPAGGHPSVAASHPFMLMERNPDAPLFEGPYEARFEKIRSRYPTARAALLPTLNMAQELRGHLSSETMDEVARLLGLSGAFVRGVATFYTMYNKRPVGRFLVQVCTNVSCNLAGADDVLAAFLERADAPLGGTSSDGNFTVVEAECLAACGFPTCVQINERYYEDVSVEDVGDILDRLRHKASKRKGS